MSDPSFAKLLEFIRSSRGFDFSGYKPAGLERRVRKRMHEAGVEQYADYIEYLEVHPEEFGLLFNTILINVTSFFRDPAAWEYLRKEALPDLLRSIGPDAPVRVWSAGCASGEEAYSAAMVLADALGDDAFRERVKIYATDVDEDALEQARHPAFPVKARGAVPDDLAERYLDATNHNLTFRPDLRRAIIFGRNDLVRDAPISRIDLLLCRNTLMYFNAETQSRILERFHFALRDHGLLFLGKSEMLVTHSQLFTPLSRRPRVFRKTAEAPPAGQPRFMVNGEDSPAADAPGAGVRDVALDTSRHAQIVVDAGGRLSVANNEARRLFGISLTDIGRPLQDLEVSYRPVELRSAIDRANAQRLPVLLPEARLGSGDDPRRLEVEVLPLLNGETLIGTAVVFTDITDQRRLQDELTVARRDLETAYEELQSTVEELETTNEELQSTNEELETTNEELQSTNEELETMNEELQSTNEELETINDELRQRSDELDQVNGFLETILTSLGVAVMVVDRDARVQVWNRKSEDLWGLREAEVIGQHLLALDIGLPVEHLAPSLRRVLGTESEREEVELKATNRRGQNISVRVTSLPTRRSEGEPRGAMLLIEEMPDGDQPNSDGPARRRAPAARRR